MSKPIKLPSGSWRAQWFDHAGKRQSATFKTIDAARSAIRRRETEVDDIRAGRKDPGSDRTFADVAALFLAARPPGKDARRIDARIARRRLHLDRHLLPLVGALPIYAIGPDAIDALVAALVAKNTARKGEVNAEGRKLAATTIRKVLTTFRLVMKYGRKPVTVELPQGLRQEKAHAGKRPAAIAVASEVSRYLDECKPEWFRVASAISIYSGLRKGEIASLRWDAVDFKEESIAVRSSWEGAPKNDQERTVPLPPELAAVLRRWRLETGAAGDGRVIVRPGFDSSLRPLLECDPLARYTERACKRAKIAPVRFHDLRSTFATHAADSGMPIGSLRALMGHSSITTTAIYLRSDSAQASADPRARLSFGRPSGKVVAPSANGAMQVPA